MHPLVEEIKSKLSSVDADFADKKYLLAVSGGLDSMALANVAVKLRLNVTLVHCNFQLRGYESDEDESFVREFAAHAGVPYVSTRFNTEEEKKGGESIQMVARRLRYNYFDQLMKSEGFDYLLLAHHLDDQIEGFFINFLRGTGVKGLIGMLPLSGYKLRPMLDLTKNDIEQYSNYLEMEYREDSSNYEYKYVRNKIRHHVMPLLKEIRPEVYQIFQNNSSKISLAQDALDSVVADMLNTLNNDNISFHDFKEYHDYFQLSYLQQFGFNESQLKNLYEAQSGSRLYSTSHQILIDREFFTIQEYGQTEQKPTLINSIDETGKTLNARMVAGAHIESDLKLACVDHSKLNLPMILRRWQYGDAFVPLGMKGRKKLSDFFIDEKFDQVEKEGQMVLENGDGRIIWIVGKRVSDEFKVTSNTTETVVFETISE